ncbi:hypothetical protein [Rhizorhapis sp.]|uniref:hypothetical protein n=1 Tax=Rhizorhapis sp. TaxID=1968842 RepID=UPI002B47AC3C|nr:hypothetical protein [Rhizorhapis sp.]HKR17652.1 hypothetical protein [Rhizorhapis sp.]
MTEAKLVRIECNCSPDVHLGDGRRLLGPVREGTRVVKHGDVAEVEEALANHLLDSGQCIPTKRPVTVEPLA